MSDTTMRVGSIGWVDLTVGDAEGLRDFYSQVVGWEPSAVDMGGYSDYCMNEPAARAAVAGICHAQGSNAGLPRQWLIYLTVADLDQAVERCQELGGKVIAPIRTMGSQGRFCVIEDPAGAVAALFQSSA